MDRSLAAVAVLVSALVVLVLPASASAVTTGEITRALAAPEWDFGSVAGSVSSDYCDRPGGCDETHYWVVAIEVSRPDSACPNGEAPPPPGAPPTSIAVFQSEPQISSGTVQFDIDVELLGSPEEQVCVYASSVEAPCADPTDPGCLPTGAQLFSISAPFTVGGGPGPHDCPPDCPTDCPPPDCPTECPPPGCVQDPTPPECPPACPDPCLAGCPDPGTDFSLFALASRQKVRSLFVKLSLPERGLVTVTGTVHVANAARVYKLRPVSTDALPGATLKIRVRVQTTARRAVARALRRGKRAFAKLTITAKDAASNTRIERRTVNFKR